MFVNTVLYSLKRFDSRIDTSRSASSACLNINASVIIGVMYFSCLLAVCARCCATCERVCVIEGVLCDVLVLVLVANVVELREQWRRVVCLRLDLLGLLQVLEHRGGVCVLWASLALA